MPTILYFLKQTVNIPVPGARVRRRGDLHGFHTGQGSTGPLRAEQNVDIPVPRQGGRRLQGPFPEQDSTALTVEQIVDIAVPLEGLQGSRPGQGSASSSFSHSFAGVLDDEDEQFDGVFRTFPVPKKVRGSLPHSGSELGATLLHPHRRLSWRAS